MFRFLKFRLGLLLLAATPFIVSAQQQTSKRPQIGIAFEGGGALGLGHIKVLEWLEANHMPIDWDEVLRGQIAYKELAFRRKPDSRAYPKYIELGLKNALPLPGGINSGQQVKYILYRAARPYLNIKSFDDLPIPFRCLATEMVSGTAHVCKDGSHSEALRATMSLPAPVLPRWFATSWCLWPQRS